MRLHISLDDDLVGDLDRRVGARRRSAFIAAAVRSALDDQRRWSDIESAIGRIADDEQAWDADPAGWVQAERLADTRRVG